MCLDYDINWLGMTRMMMASRKTRIWDRILGVYIISPLYLLPFHNESITEMASR